MAEHAAGQIVTHDPERGLSYIYLAGRTLKGGVKRTVSATPHIKLDFDADGALIGIELLRGGLLHPALAAVALPPGRRDVG